MNFGTLPPPDGYDGRFYSAHTFDLEGDGIYEIETAMAKPAVVVSEDNRSSVNQVTAASSFTSPGSLSSPMSGFVFGPTFSSDSRLM